MTELDSPDNLMFQMTIPVRKYINQERRIQTRRVELRTEGGNKDRRGQEGDVFATQNTPRRLYKGAPGVRASDLLQTIINSDLNQT